MNGELPAISVRDVRKDYRLGVINRRTFRDEILYRWFRFRGHDARAALGRIGDPRLEGDGLFHALDGVSFEIRPGEAVGLIGRNGAGKSTMLKILARVTTPTSGEADIWGRTGSLLEVGTGFHPELTGRENVYMNGTILGMKRREIDRKFDEIVSFAEIGPFLDTPVKRYSSGMYVKLAFSVASSLDTDVLLVDEVLAVGDAAFRRKSIARMRELARSGRTIVFVSHSVPSVRELCSRCIWFQDGRIFREGPSETVTDEYLTATARGSSVPLAEREDRGGSGSVHLTGADVAFDDRAGAWTARLSYAVRGGFRWAAPRAALTLRRKDGRGGPIAVFDSAAAGGLPGSIPSEGALVLTLSPDVRLPADVYSVDVRLWSGTGVCDHVSGAAVLRAPDSAAAPGWRTAPWCEGLLNLRHAWRAE